MDRVTDLEVKLAFVERHVLDLDAVVRDLADQVERMQKELAALRDVAMPQEKSTAESERPPHY